MRSKNTILWIYKNIDDYTRILKTEEKIKLKDLLQEQRTIIISTREVIKLIKTGTLHITDGKKVIGKIKYAGENLLEIIEKNYEERLKGSSRHKNIAPEGISFL